MKHFVKVLAVFLLAAAFAGCGTVDTKSALKFGTGDKGGKYYLYGTNFTEKFSSENKNLTFDVKNTAGSAANLRLLGDGFLDAAIVQSDMLSDSLAGKGMFETKGAGTGYAALAGIYTEACQIIVAEGSNIQSVNDLAGKRISLGEKESGVLQNAEQILSSHGLSVEIIEPVYLSFTDSAAALERGEIDAFFCTAGTPTKAIAELGKKMPLRLLSISPEVLQNMMKIYPGYTQCTIPAGTYPGQTEDISALGVKAVLVVNSSVPESVAEEMTKFLLTHGKDIAASAELQDELTIDYATSEIPSGFHTGAAKYYKAQGKDVAIYDGPNTKRLDAKQE